MSGYSPVDRLSEDMAALTDALDDLHRSAQDPDAPAQSLEMLAGQLQAIANHLDRYAESLIHFWADARTANERLIELIDPGSDADLSMVRGHRDKIVRLRKIMHTSHSNFDHLRALFDSFRANHANPELETAIHDAIRACLTLKQAVETADAHAAALIDAYDGLLNNSGF